MSNAITKNMLLGALADSGWERLAVDDESTDWWNDEQWHIQSTRENLGDELFLTFLVDPMRDGPRKRGQGVWAIGACGSRPRDSRQAASIATAQLRNDFEADLARFMSGLDAYRRRAVR